METVIFDELDDEFEDYTYEDLVNLFDNSYANHLYVVSGDVGLWEGRRNGYCPRVATSIQEAINFATDGWGICYLKIFEENYGRLYVRVAHHDGVNNLEIRELTAKGEDLLLISDVGTVLNRAGATRNVKYTKRYY